MNNINKNFKKINIKYKDFNLVCYDSEIGDIILFLLNGGPGLPCDYLRDPHYEHLIKKGIYKINLGGSVINKPGIEQYKKSFRSNQSPSKYLKIILNQDMYDFNCIDGTMFPTFKKR